MVNKCRNSLKFLWNWIILCNWEQMPKKFEFFRGLRIFYVPFKENPCHTDYTLRLSWGFRWNYIFKLTRNEIGATFLTTRAYCLEWMKTQQTNRTDSKVYLLNFNSLRIFVTGKKMPMRVTKKNLEKVAFPCSCEFWCMVRLQMLNCVVKRLVVSVWETFYKACPLF